MRNLHSDHEQNRQNPSRRLREGPRPRPAPAAPSGPRARTSPPPSPCPTPSRGGGGGGGAGRDREAREAIMLGSNNSRGLTGDERVKGAAREALETYGTGVTGSRLLNGTTPLHVELERELAEWMGTEDAIVYTTGYQANLGCIGTILEPGATVICDSGDPASLLDGRRRSGPKRRPSRRNRMEKLEKMLGRAAEDGGGVLVAVDGVFSMEGDVCDLPRIVELCQEHGARLLVDEAHGAGVLGARGAGASELFGLEDEVDLRMGTFSKSL